MPTCIDVLKEIARTRIFDLSERMIRVVSDCESEQDAVVETLKQALSTSVNEMRNYCLYAEGKTSFSTHQGVKGLEYPRVMVIMDDAEAEGKGGLRSMRKEDFITVFETTLLCANLDVIGLSLVDDSRILG